MHADRSAPEAAAAGAESPISIAQPDGGGACASALMDRVGRVLQDLACARTLSDAEIRQHAADCTLLMERAYERFMDTSNPHDRDEAYRWMFQRDEANKQLSTEWKAAREHQIRSDIAGSGYFIDQGDAARTRLTGGRR